MRRHPVLFAGIVSALGALHARPADAAQTLRVQVDQHGDFVMIGNSLGQDCGAGVPAPVVGTVGACGLNTADSSPDVFWRSEQPTATTATASTAITLAQARSTAILAVPTGAQITHAYLYWAARRTGAGGDNQITLDRPGGFTSTVTADQVFTVPTGGETVYQSVTDVTALVKAQNEGAYRVAGVDATNFVNLNQNVTFAAWSMVVFYSLATDPTRNLALFDGLDNIAAGVPSNVSLSGFLVPTAGFDAKLGAITYEGDAQITGDSILFGKAPLTNANRLSDAQNPIDNFFNGTRSRLGAAVSVAGDLPQLTGGPRSHASADLDIVDVTSRLTAGQTSVDIQATSTQDVYYLGAFVTSISTFKPDFNSSTKSVVDLNGGSVVPGDVLEYTLDFANTGNDTATNVIMTDVIPAGVTYQPGSTTIAGVAKTDAAGDDQANYSAATKTLTARLGTGATAAAGGSMAINAAVLVKFRVTVDATASGTISNQANITATGLLGAPPATTPTDGNGGGAGQPPTDVVLDQCTTSADCSGAKPVCDTAATPKVCVQCLAKTDCPASAPVCNLTTKSCSACATDADCPAALPACLAGGACGECSGTNAAKCTGSKPLCDTTASVCVACLTGTDCGSTTPVCGASKTCVGCTTDANCGGATPACQTSGACGQCSGSNKTQCVAVCDTASGRCAGCLSNADCGAGAPVCNLGTKTCGPCVGDADCSGGTPACEPGGVCGQCSATNKLQCTGATPACNLGTGTCAGCLSSADCGAGAPVCNLGTKRCGPCVADTDCSGGTPACEPSGACGQCSGTNRAQCTGATPVCNTVIGACAGCLSGADCGATAPVCNGATRTCGPCLADADCSGATPACRPSGVCGQCSATNRSQCTGATPLCNAAGTCTGCVADADCPSTAPQCDTGTHVCVCPGAAGSCADADGDGLSDAVEISIGTNPNDADSDDDGVADGREPGFDQDTDGDGVINAQDPDSDNDGLYDGTELGLGCAGSGTDVTRGHCRADADQGATRTDPLNADTDGGGVRDGSEDWNLDGAIQTGETDPTAGHGADDATVIDTDQDGLSDNLEKFLGSSPEDADSDDDGVPDGQEANPSEDVDGDGLVDVLDVDSDNDGLYDGTEVGKGCSGAGTLASAGHCIADGDSGATVTSMLLADTDGGGARDGSEDANRNGVKDAGEQDPTRGHGADDTSVVDTDGDGLSDALELTLGSSPTDADSDDDGVPDGREANPGDDTDGDGRRNVLDEDSDGDGLFDGTEVGLGCSNAATNVAVGHCRADADQGATTTSMVNPDTDRGGVKDGDEDTNHDGATETGERDPNDARDDLLPDGGVRDGGAGGAGGTGGATDAGLRDGGADASAGGTPASGGSAGAGGASTGGAGGASGGSGGGAGAPGTGGATAGAPGTGGAGQGSIQGGGCACEAVGHGPSAPVGAGALVALALAAGLGRRRRRSGGREG
jgi:uncharacterized repeat protein (TIGR01451 family)